MAEDGENVRLLDKLLDGSSPQAPTYVLATILCDFVARKGTTELSVRRGDDVYVMFALQGWAFVAHMKPGRHRGYVPLGYCEAVKDFYASPAQDTQNKRGVQQKNQPIAVHSNGHSTGEEAPSTDLTAQPCEIYPPPKEFQSSSTSEPNIWQNPEEIVQTSHAPPLRPETGTALGTKARVTAMGRGSYADYDRPALGSPVTSRSRLLEPDGSALVGSLGSSFATLATVFTSTVREAAHPRPEHDCCWCTGCDDKQQLQQGSLLPPLKLPPPSSCLSQDESGIGESNGSTSSSLDWCWEVPLPPAASAAATASDKHGDTSAGYATSSCGSGRSSRSCSLDDPRDAAAEICPCCLCPWPCANTTLSTCTCLCQGLQCYATSGHERPAALSVSGQQPPNESRGYTEAHRYREEQSDRVQPSNLSTGGSTLGCLQLTPLPPSSEALQSLLRPPVVAAEASYGDDEVFMQPWLSTEGRLHSKQGNYPTRSVTFNLQPIVEQHCVTQRIVQQPTPSAAKPYPGRPWYEPYR